jgi:hypothetical protein
MRGISHNVEVQAPQLDGIKAHIRNNQFVYGLAAGFVLATILNRRQVINITIPREKY